MGVDFLSEVSWLTGAVCNVGRGNFSEADLLKPRPNTQKAKMIQVSYELAPVSGKLKGARYSCIFIGHGLLTGYRARSLQ